MELRQLRSFLTLAETLSFSKAANQLCIAQSTLSEQIQQLEFELGVPLFHRSSHHVQLTEIGEKLQILAARTCQNADACKTIVKDTFSGPSGTLRIGVTSTCKSLITNPLRNFSQTHPGVQIHIAYTNALNIRQLLTNRQVDFAITLFPKQISDDIRSEVIWQDRLCVICSTTHALSQQPFVHLSDLQKYPIILPSHELYYRSELDRLCRDAGIEFHPRIEINDPDYIIEVVEHSQFITLHAGLVACGKHNLRAIPIKECSEIMQGGIHYLKDCPTKVSAHELIQQIRQEASMLQLRI